MISQTTNETPDALPATRIMSILILVACLIIVVMVAHHPVAKGSGQAEKILSLHSVSEANQFVHGAIMLVLALLTSAMMHFSALLGFRRPAVLTAAIFYVLATVLLFVAMTIDGFVIPMIGARCATAAVDCLQRTQDMLSLASIFVQSFTRIGEFATAIAILFWSIALLHFAGITRMVGIAAAALPIAHVVLLFGAAAILTPHSLLMLVGVQIVWYVLVAALMAGWFGLRLVPRES